MKKSKSKDGGKKAGGKKISRNFSMTSVMAHDSSTASAMAIAGAVAAAGGNDTGPGDGAADLFVLLTVQHARGLKPMNTNRKSDPYCVIRYLHVERRTRTHKNTLDPDFQQHFFFKAPTELDVAEAEEANSAFTNPQEMTIYVMDDDFGFKDNVQGYITIPIPRVTGKFVHEEYTDVQLKEAEHHGSYKELQTLKSSWMERKLKRKLAKSHTPGDLGTLSLSVTVFGANLLRDALRRESSAAMLALPKPAFPDGGGGGGGGGGDKSASAEEATAGNIGAGDGGDLLALLLRRVEAQDAIVLQAQEELQQAFLSHRHPGSGDGGGSTAADGAPEESFETAVDQVMATATVQLAAADKADEIKTGGTASPSVCDAVKVERAEKLLESQRKYFMSLHVSMASYVDAKIAEAVEAEAEKRRVTERKLRLATKQLKKTMEVLRKQAATSAV